MSHDKKMLIIHGYSDGSSSFTSLKEFFVQNADYAPDNVHLLDYASMDDEASYRDFADKLDTEYERIFGKERIDVAVHSTGGLIVRIWLALRRVRQRELGKAVDCPVKRIIMLAPAHFGSDLAKMGNSFLGKFRSTFFNDNSNSGDFMESGKVVLQGLEPASPFQWGLSKIDLHQEDYFSYKSSPQKRCYPFIFAAGNSYKGLQAKVVKQRKKPGTDGTVRICGTSLNTRKCTLSLLNDQPKLKWHPETKFASIPFAVFDKFNHGSIINTGFSSEADDSEDRKEDFMSNIGPGKLILDALKVENEAQYKEASKNFQEITKKNYAQMDEEYRGRFQQFFFKVRDDINRAVDDYFLDFSVETPDGNEDIAFSEKVDELMEAKIHVHSDDKSCRVMMVNVSKIKSLVEEMKKNNCKLILEITAKPLTRDISYKGGRYVIFDSSVKTQNNFLHPNTTTLVDVIINRKETKNLLVIDREENILNEDF
jgi:hypothetical protein